MTNAIKKLSMWKPAINLNAILELPRHPETSLLWYQAGRKSPWTVPAWSVDLIVRNDDSPLTGVAGYLTVSLSPPPRFPEDRSPSPARANYWGYAPQLLGDHLLFNRCHESEYAVLDTCQWVWCVDHCGSSNPRRSWLLREEACLRRSGKWHFQMVLASLNIIEQTRYTNPIVIGPRGKNRIQRFKDSTIFF